MAAGLLERKFFMNDAPYESHIGLTEEKLSIILKSSFVTPSTADNRIHWHEGVELLFITGGSGYMLCDSKIIPLTQGDIAVASSNCLHRAAAEHGKMCYDYLILEPPLFEFLSLSPSNLAFRPKISGDTKMWSILKQIIQLYENRGSFNWIIQKGLLLQLIGHMMVNCIDNTSPEDIQLHKKNEPVRMALDFIKKNYKKPLSLEALCDYTGFSKYYFCRLFKQMTGQTVTRYINGLRCREVQKLLQNTAMTAEEAALECGFANVSHFYRMYKQHMGHLPSQDKLVSQKQP